VQIALRRGAELVARIKPGLAVPAAPGRGPWAICGGFGASPSLVTLSQFRRDRHAMDLTRRRALALAASLAASTALPAHAQQNWPQRSLRILIGTTPGGSPDIVGRLLADKMAGPLGQSITVENNTGGGGGIAAGIVSNAPPDGYAMTLLTAGFASGAAVGKFKFDGDNTFAFITMVCSYPFVYMVPKDSPIKSFPDMLARAKANPGKLSYVITSLGAVYHLIGTWVGMQAGIEMVPISYRGSSAAVTDVVGGRVDVMLEPATSGFPRAHAGQFRVLAVTSPGRYSLMPEAPTVAETLPGVQYMSWLGMATSPHTPRPVVDRLNKEIHRALELPDVKQRLKEGGNVATPSTPEGMRKQIEDEIANWKQIVAANKIEIK
jgi:tripartite-type tricarboxylate transporter receptor subunit TctC